MLTPLWADADASGIGVSNFCALKHESGGTVPTWRNCVFLFLRVLPFVFCFVCVCVCHRARVSLCVVAVVCTCFCCARVLNDLVSVVSSSWDWLAPSSAGSPGVPPLHVPPEVLPHADLALPGRRSSPPGLHFITPKCLSCLPLSGSLFLSAHAARASSHRLSSSSSIFFSNLSLRRSRLFEIFFL